VDANARFFYSVSVGSKDHILHLKLVNASNSAQALTIDLGAAGAHAASIITLHAASYEATNSLAEPNVITPKMTTEPIPATAWHHTVPALAIQVIDIPLR